jgi:cytochrome c oxidase subunit III
MSEASRETAFDSGREENDAATFGMWIFIASEAMLFGGLLLVSAIGRIQHPAGFAEASGHLKWQLGVTNTAILLVSSFFIARAHEFSLRPAPRLWRRALATTGLLGLAFLGIKFYEWQGEIAEGLAPFFGLSFSYEGPDSDGAGLFFRCYFVLTGLHALHMVGGLSCILWLLASRWRGMGPSRLQPVRNLALCWHFVDIVWIFLFPLLYLIAPA